jgi:hypothetical protein
LLLKTFLDANPDSQESVHCDFLTIIVARKMWLKKQHYKVHTRLGGQIQAVHFSGSLNSRTWTSYKTVLSFSKLLVSRRPKHFVYQNLTSIILHLNRNNWEHKK